MPTASRQCRFGFGSTKECISEMLPRIPESPLVPHLCSKYSVITALGWFYFTRIHVDCDVEIGWSRFGVHNDIELEEYRYISIGMRRKGDQQYAEWKSAYLRRQNGTLPGWAESGIVTLFGQGSSGESCELITIAVDMLGVVRKSENVLPRMNLCFTGDQLIGNVFFTVWFLDWKMWWMGITNMMQGIHTHNQDGHCWIKPS